MENTHEILYYESMIDLVRENQKINEAIIGSKYVNILNENKEEVAVTEAGLVSAIFKFIQKIFEKIIDFISRLLKFASNKKMFTPKKQLIAACHERMKSITREERDSFLIEGILISEEVDEIVGELEQDIQKTFDILDDIDENIKIISKRVQYSSSLHITSSLIDEYNDNLKAENIILRVKSSAKDVSYNNIPDILNLYSETAGNINDYMKKLNQYKTQVKEYKDNINRVSKKNIIENLVSDYLGEYKETIYKACAYIIKACNIQIKLMKTDYDNIEKVLIAFAYGKDAPSADFENIVQDEV